MLRLARVLRVFEARVRGWRSQASQGDQSRGGGVPGGHRGGGLGSRLTLPQAQIGVVDTTLNGLGKQLATATSALQDQEYQAALADSKVLWPAVQR